MEGKFTVYFDDPFWVGVCERQDESGYSVARVVFGSEPNEAELYQFIQEYYREFEFTCPTKMESLNVKEKNFKRVQREVRQLLRSTGVGTKAQEALKLALAQHKQERRQTSRAERQQAVDERFQQRQKKKKEKQRGR